MSEEVKKTGTAKYFYLTIFNSINNGLNLGQISKKIKVSKQRLSYYVQHLKKAGIIKYASYGVWEISGKLDLDKLERSKNTRLGNLSKQVKNDNFLHCLKENDIRGHGFTFRLKIPKISNWHKRKEFLDKRNIQNDPLRFGNVALTFKGRRVHLNNHSIIVYESNSYFSKFASETKSLAIYEFTKLLRKLERFLKISFKIRGNYVFKIPRQHFALVKNSLARQYDKEGRKLHCYTTHGCWCIIDNSWNLFEIEILKDRSPDKDQAIKDTEGMQDYMNSMKRTGFKVTPEFVLDVMNGIQKNQLVFDSNMSSHLEVLNNLSLAVGKLNDTLDSGTLLKRLKSSVRKLSDIFRHKEEIERLDEGDKEEFEQYLFKLK